MEPNPYTLCYTKLVVAVTAFLLNEKTKIGRQPIQIILKFVLTPMRNSVSGVGVNTIEKTDVKLVFKKELDEEKTAWLTEEQNFYTNSIPHLGKI